MSQRAILTNKTREPNNKENSVSQEKRTNFSAYKNAPTDQILLFQRTIGNQAVKRLLKSCVIQAKLSIGQPGDIFEQEADRVAEQVMRMPEPSTAGRKGVSKGNKFSSIQRMCTDCEEELHRQPVEEEEELVQAKEVSGRTPEVSSSVESQINSIRGGGQLLPESVRAFFEPRFGQDFSQVRIHTDSNASESAKSVNALAYTLGQDVVFGAGQYKPNTEFGKKLIAHELTHVVQQTGAGMKVGLSPITLQRTIDDGHDLQSERFAGDPILEACFDNERLLMTGNRGPAVEKVQGLLVDSGFSLPNFGVDGIFGAETKRAVREFQTAAELSVDGIVGPNTIGRMDTLPECPRKPEPDVVTAFAPGLEKDQQPILCQILGGGGKGGRKLPSWTPDFIAITLLKLGLECVGEANRSRTILYSKRCEPETNTCFSTVRFKALFHFDIDGIPRPQPFTTAQVSAHFDFVTDDGKKTFTADRADPDAKYDGPGAPLKTLFDEKFDVDTTKKTGVLTVNLSMKDKSSGINLVYNDQIKIVPIDCA